jgi:small subunit ribosomal protein S6
VNTYEAVLIIDPTLEEAALAEKFGKLEEIIKAEGAEIVNTISWGKRKLAYSIRKKDNGIYQIYRFNADPSTIKEIERRFKLDEQLMRFLIVLYDPETEHKPKPVEDEDN